MFWAVISVCSLFMNFFDHFEMALRLGNIKLVGIILLTILMNTDAFIPLDLKGVALCTYCFGANTQISLKKKIG